MTEMTKELEQSASSAIRRLAPPITEAIECLRHSTLWLLRAWPRDKMMALGSAVPYLDLRGLTAGGWHLARAAVAAQRRLETGAGEVSFLRAKIASAGSYVMNLLPSATGNEAAIVNGSTDALSMPEVQF
jgi:hypothetical protein